MATAEDHAGRHPEPMTLHEKRVDAMLQLIAGSGGACAAAHRQAQERLRDVDYDAEDYYGRWLAVLRQIVVETGVVTDDELRHRVAALDARGDDQR